MNGYRTIRETDDSVETLYEIQKSRFITHIRHVETEEEARAFIQAMKKQYFDARHNCSAYVLGERADKQKSNDDGEPGGTAGNPILEAIKKNALTDVVIVVTRYFGGIKLGAGGLTRAYSGALSDAVKAAPIVTYTPYARYTVTLPYTAVGGFENYIKDKDIRVLDRAFAAEVQVAFLTLPEEAKTHLKFLTDLTGGKAVIEEDGEEYVKVRVW